MEGIANFDAASLLAAPAAASPQSAREKSSKLNGFRACRNRSTLNDSRARASDRTFVSGQLASDQPYLPRQRIEKSVWFWGKMFFLSVCRW